MTTIPCLVAVGTSTLSTPVPARPISFSLPPAPAAITSAVTLVADRTIRPSYFWTRHGRWKVRGTHTQHKIYAHSLHITYNIGLYFVYFNSTSYVLSVIFSHHRHEVSPFTRHQKQHDKKNLMSRKNDIMKISLHHVRLLYYCQLFGT